MKTKFTLPFFLLALLFCVSLIVSNIIAGKLWDAPGAVLTAGVLVFPIVYIVGDVIPEVYGLAMARKVIWAGFAANLYAVAFFTLALKVPYPQFFEAQPAYETVLGFTPRLLLASFTAYLVGTNVNALIMVSMKKLTQGRWLALRTITSTLFGEGLDSTIFITLAFAGILPVSALPQMIFAQAAFKIAYEIIATPLTYVAVSYVKRLEGSGAML